MQLNTARIVVIRGLLSVLFMQQNHSVNLARLWTSKLSHPVLWGECGYIRVEGGGEDGIIMDVMGRVQLGDE